MRTIRPCLIAALIAITLAATLLTPALAHEPAGSELWLLDYETLEWNALPSSGSAAPALFGHDVVWIAGGTLIVVVGGGETWLATLSA